MKRVLQKYCLLAVCLGIMTLLVPTYSAALEAIRCGDIEWSVWGFLRNNAGMFTQKNPTFSQSGNQLATMRTWLRAYSDLKFGDTFRIWTVLQLVHEPWYPIEGGNWGKKPPNGLSEASSSRNGKYTDDVQHGGREYSEYDDINQVLREFYVEWRPAPTTSFKIGRQIAIWGEALGQRVGDVIQPDDTRFTFSFANLEDTRIPQWMIRGIHTFPSINSSFEWIINPNINGGKYLVNRSGQGTQVGSVAQRFGGEPELRFQPGDQAMGLANFPNPVPLALYNPRFVPLTYGVPGAVGNAALLGASNIILTNPTSRDWYYDAEVPGNHYAGLYLPFIQKQFPGTSMENFWRGGFRTQTMRSGSTFGVSYYHTQEYNPTLVREEVVVLPQPLVIPTPGGPLVVAFKVPGYRQYTFRYPNEDIFGAYFTHVFDKFPGVFRSDAIYIPNKVFPSMAIRDQDGMTRRDYVKYMIGYDLNGFFYFPWHKDAAFNVTMEHVGEWVPANSHAQFITFDTEVRQWNPSFSFMVSTSWLYNLIQTSLLCVYTPTGNSGFIIPSVGFTPSWFNSKLTFNLQYMNMYGDNGTEGLGFFRGKNMIVLTSQFDW